MYENQMKALRWLANMFPYTHPAKSETDKMINCIHLYCEQGANAIEELSMKLHGDEATIAGMKREIERLVVADKPRWIPVTERLPNCNGCYLVWRPHFFGGEIGMPSICYFDGSNTWHDSYGVDFERILHPDDVTHWMPLPKPPMEAGG